MGFWLKSPQTNPSVNAQQQSLATEKFKRFIRTDKFASRNDFDINLPPRTQLLSIWGTWKFYHMIYWVTFSRVKQSVILQIWTPITLKTELCCALTHEFRFTQKEEKKPNSVPNPNRIPKKWLSRSKKRPSPFRHSLYILMMFFFCFLYKRF